MAIEVEKSAIKEVRDQLGIDSADGKFLNVLTANLGITRPVIGFGDELWRALVKAIALDFKQVVTQFHIIMEIFFGPRITKVGTLAEDADSDATTVILNRVENLPQRGTMVLDEGLASEETIDFCLIDRETNTVFLNEPLEFGHTALPFDDEKALFLVDGLKLYVSDVTKFPFIVAQYTVVVGRGTPQEEIALVDSVDANERTITLAAPLTNTHFTTVPTVIQDALLTDYFTSSILLHLNDVELFPDEGNVLLGASSNSFAETVGSSTLATVAPSTFTATRQTGYIVRFDGNITAALADVEIPIAGNTATVITFVGSLPVSSAVGDTFSIRPVVGYRFVDRETQTLTLFRPIENLSFPATTSVELLETKSTVAIGSVQMKGAGWDIFQSDPKNVEILLPEVVFLNDLRSASYIHNEQILPVPTTTLAVGTGIGALSFLPTTDINDFPVAGVLVLDPGGATEENIGYFKEVKVEMVPAVIDSTGAPFSPIDFVDGGAGNDSIVRAAGSFLDDGFVPGQIVVISDADNPANDITTALLGVNATNLIVGTGLLTADTGNLAVAIETQDIFLVALTAPVSAHLAAQTIELYQPVYSGTDLLDGRFRADIDLWPGPYVYDTTAPAPTGANGPMELRELLAGPTEIALRPLIGNTAMEVKDATAFPLTGFPHSAVVGPGAGNSEVVNVFGVSLKQRTVTDTDGAVLVGSTSILVTNLAPIAIGGTFPNARGYRVLINNIEVCYVIGTSGSSLLLESPTTIAHADAVPVELLADVVRLESLSDGHFAIIDDIVNRSTATEGPIAATGTALNPKISSTQIGRAEVVQVLHPTLDLDFIIALPSGGDDVLLNFSGNQITVEDSLDGVVAPAVTVITINDSSGFPTVFPYVITISSDLFVQETVRVIGNNVGLNELTLDSPTRNTHADEAKVRWIPGSQETLSYSSISGTTLNFSTSFVVQSTHSPSELVLPTTVDSIPRNNGFDFPFRMPVDITEQIRFILDFLRASGVQVTFINQR